MVPQETIVILLAAGKGTRLRSDRAKVLHRAGGRTLVEHVVRACHQALGKRPIFAVIGHQADEVRAAVAPFGVKTIVQQPQRGTGHAVLVAREAIGRGARVGLVVPGDAPLVRAETLLALVRAHQSGRAAATILTAMLGDPTGYGRILRKKDGSVGSVVEENAANETQRKICEVNSGIYCFTLEQLWPCLERLRPDNTHHELYLTDAVALLNERGEKVLAEVALDAQEILGCNTRAELAEVDRLFRRRKAAALMDSGVTIYLPETVIIDAEVEIGCDSILEPCVQLLGKTTIGSGCTIRTGSVITDSVLKDGVVVESHSVVASSRLGEGVEVGPFARLRPGSDLRPGSRIGNFVEVKNTVVGDGTKAMHLTYLGDATIGRNANIGAGTITCNYDGVRKNPTTIGERVFVGSNTALVAPVKVADGAYIAAGSTITDDVPPDALAIARGRQVNKRDWARGRRREVTAQEESPQRAERRENRGPKSGSRTTPRRKPSRRR